MSKIKYMGTADVRKIEKGEDFGGRLAEPLESDVVWDWDNNHLIDSEEAGLSDEAVELLTEDDDFKDVTDLKRIPTSEGERMWRGLGKTQDPEDIEALEEETETARTTSSGKRGTRTSEGEGGGTAAGGSSGARATGATGGATGTGGSTSGTG